MADVVEDDGVRRRHAEPGAFRVPRLAGHNRNVEARRHPFRLRWRGLPFEWHDHAEPPGADRSEAIEGQVERPQEGSIRRQRCEPACAQQDRDIRTGGFASAMAACTRGASHASSATTVRPPGALVRSGYELGPGVGGNAPGGSPSSAPTSITSTPGSAARRDAVRSGRGAAPIVTAEMRKRSGHRARTGDRPLDPREKKEPRLVETGVLEV